jgi:hypothetical protein
MYFQYLLCKNPCEIPMEFSSPTPELGMGVVLVWTCLMELLAVQLAVNYSEDLQGAIMVVEKMFS